MKFLDSLLFKNIILSEHQNKNDVFYNLVQLINEKIQKIICCLKGSKKG